MLYKSLDINIYPPNSLTFLCLRNNRIRVQSFARSNLVEGLDTVSDHLTFLQDHRVRRLVTSGRGALFLEAHPSGPGRLRTSMAVT